jgi:hypothetical protein
MNRRHFVVGAGAATLASAVAMEPSKPAYIELRKFLLRNTLDQQRKRLTEYVTQNYLPALVREGAGPIGLFSPTVGADAPFLLMVAQHATLDDFDRSHTKIWNNAALTSAAEKLRAGGRPYERMEVALLRCFGGFPAIGAPASASGQAARVFELRTYESDTTLSLKKKIGMFESGEIAIFRKSGLAPIFFGERLAGEKMPSLTYMVAFDNLAAREAAWRAFGTSEEWHKLSTAPGLSDGDVVSNISNLLLSPVAGSQIR